MIVDLLGLLVVTLVYAAISGSAAWNGAEILGQYGVFGSGAHGGKELGIIFIGFPVLWALFFALLFAVHGLQFGFLLKGWRVYAYPASAFILIGTAFFAWLLTRR
ncbi:hypothetical protein MHY87_05615 [Microvirga sp. ACRRW]|uniref:hypothetical protein n=1 Tax=Microvirga sp. ACRRW TaxID=2918205 RepID=UPI001EF4A845|nr:hypothetical protein [Microvirga sp. ACRRW]MCG7392379.1 hypothetical protein [Microvirga sp. ACRRW]